MPKCKICGYHDDTDAEFDWSRTICDACAEKGNKAIIEYHNVNRREWFVLPMIGGDSHGLYYSDSMCLTYSYACAVEHSVEHAREIYERYGDVDNGRKIRKAYNDYIRALE